MRSATISTLHRSDEESETGAQQLFAADNPTTPRKSATGTPSKRPHRAAAVAADANRRKALNELDEFERSELSQTPETSTWLALS
jgi:hypothetical protein